MEENKRKAENLDQLDKSENIPLECLAYPVDFAGNLQCVIEDEALIQWAKNNGVSLRDAQIEVLRSKIIPLRYIKNCRPLTISEQRSLCESRVVVCGCGGLGGVIINLLARAGVGTLRLVDSGDFDQSSLNRQWFCDIKEIARPKVESTKDRVRLINPFIDVEVFHTYIDDKSVTYLVEGMDIIIDALDCLKGRFLLASTAKRLGLPFIHSAAVGWWGQLCTFLPDSLLDLHSVYGYGYGYEHDEESKLMGVLGPAPAVIGGLAAFEAIRLITGKNPAYADQLCYLDGENGRVDVIQLE